MASFRFLTTLSLSVLTAACAPMVDTHGDALDTDDLHLYLHAKLHFSS